MTSFPLLQFGRCSLPATADLTVPFTSLLIKGQFVFPTTTSTTSPISTSFPTTSEESKKRFYKRSIVISTPAEVSVVVGGEGAGATIEGEGVEEIGIRPPSFVKTFPFAHAVHCPVRHGTYCRKEAAAKHEGTMYEMPRPAASVVLVTPTGKCLVTQRSSHMRTFPSKWVCPGGGVDDAETFEEAAIREVSEEVGVQVESTQLNFLGCWESVFEPEPSAQIPKRQHFVVFYACLLDGEIPVESLSLQTEECQAAAWIPLPPKVDAENHLSTRKAPPLGGLPQDAVVSEGMYFFICETARRFHDESLWTPPALGAGTQYES